MSTRRASPDAIQIHRRRDGVCELLVNANLLSFRVRQESLYAVIYHSGGRDSTGKRSMYGI